MRRSYRVLDARGAPRLPSESATLAVGVSAFAKRFGETST
jgi:hypothetical protein